MAQEKKLKVAAIVTGLISGTSQILILRSFWSIAYGNELLTGGILAVWFLLTAIGGLIGRSFALRANTNRLLPQLLLFTGILPIPTVFLSLYLKTVLFSVGIIPDISYLMFGAVIILAPLCLLNGFLFSLFSRSISAILYSGKVNQVYLFDAAGMAVAGIVTTLFIIIGIQTFMILKGLFLLAGLAAIWLLYDFERKTLSFIAGLVIILINVAVFQVDFQHFINKELLYNQTPELQVETPFGQINITRMGHQRNVLLNSQLLYSTDNFIDNEESVHYPMIQHPQPSRVLVVSGDLTGIASELEKYNIQDISYLGIVPWLSKWETNRIKKVNEHLNIHGINQDPVEFLKSSQEQFDVILINVPEPVNFAMNRFYSVQFFEDVKDNLSPGGIMSISLPSAPGQIEEPLLSEYRRLKSTLQLLFENVLIIPDLQSYFLASDQNLSGQIAYLIELKGISANYVNPQYIDDGLQNEKRHQIESQISDKVEINNILYTIPLSLFILPGIPGSRLLFLPALVLALSLFVSVSLFQKPYKTGLFFTGFTAASMEIVLLVMVQIVSGYAYLMIPVMITLFMSGILAGGLLAVKKIPESTKSITILTYMFGLLAVITAIPVALTKGIFDHPTLILIILMIVQFLAGVITGSVFISASGIMKYPSKSTALTLNTLDLSGAAAGALLCSLVAIPEFGIVRTGLLIAIINFLAGLIILFRPTFK